MIDVNALKEQLENAKKLASEINDQNRIFDEILQETVKGVDESEKPAIEELIGLSQRAINLAKQGKGEQAQEIIKNFKPKYGGQSNE